MAQHNTNKPIAVWIARVRMSANDLISVKLTPADQQVCDRLIKGLDDSWKTIWDHLMYAPNKLSLNDAVGSLEAHKISLTTPNNHSPSDPMYSAAAAEIKPRQGCFNCGKFGHYSSSCPNPSIKNKAKANYSVIRFDEAETRASAAVTVPLGDSGSGDDEEDDYDSEIDVVWG